MILKRIFQVSADWRYETTMTSYPISAVNIHYRKLWRNIRYQVSTGLIQESWYVPDVMNVIEMEKPDGVIVSLGGQTAINLAKPLEERGVKLFGTDCAAIEKSENRDAFENLLSELAIPKPKGQAVTCIEDGVKAAEEIGYPVLVRPSFVFGGRAMQIVAKEEHLRHYLKTAVEIDAILRNFTGQCIKP